MIPFQDLTRAPKDADTMIMRKNDTVDYRLTGVAVNKKSGKAYSLEVEMNTKKLEPDSMVKVACTCHDFKFRWAYALDQVGALLNRNMYVLKPAKITNPDNDTKVCKHLHTFMKLELEHMLKHFSKRKGVL